MLSPFLTCEEAYLLAKCLKGLSGEVRLALGPAPVAGEDDTYPKDRRGRPVEPVKFTIRAEKCPNRRGVEAVLKHFQGEVLAFDRAIDAANRGELTAVWVAAGYPQGGGYVGPTPWLSDPHAAALRKAALLVVQDVLPSPVSARADYLLPAAAWAEKEGTFVNHAGLAQSFKKA